jgi:trehalose-phosphatase
MDNGLRTAAAGSLGEGRGADAVSRSNFAFTADWWRELERAPRSVLMLDFDGTLAPFVRERMHARMYPGVAERLLRLSWAPRTRLVLVSGRPARDFALVLPSELRLEIWGSHGREHITREGRYCATALNTAQQQRLEQLEAELHRQGSDSIIEKKVGSLAMHTRGLAVSDAERIISFARDFYDLLSKGQGRDSGLELLPFDGGIELRGRGYSKATAVESILGEEPPHVPAAYLGDDLTDEYAFAALNRRGPDSPSLRVLVRPQPRPSAADLWLTPPDELLAFLDRWLAAVAGASELRTGASR